MSCSNPIHCNQTRCLYCLSGIKLGYIPSVSQKRHFRNALMGSRLDFSVSDQRVTFQA